jgi:hypothetical protein
MFKRRIIMQSINNVQDLGIFQKLIFGNGKGHTVEVHVSKMGDSYFGIALDQLGRGHAFPIEGVRTVDGAFSEFETAFEAFRKGVIAREEAAEKEKAAKEYAEATKKPEVVVATKIPEVKKK